ncbi:hypothetical protein BCY86_04215 [Pajaroellobacter abortibovis]|uniref:Methyltransferase small domain-containing protein n=1 Tax=Pajaroellobacter abortibovis TaxID=1882918 RepID=A0A1L6MWY7_9BACT|nr:hypothetical protein BCY86_04215 [Pajaroellobacter abortibovis]
MRADTLFNGRLTLYQPSLGGYRTNHDAILLAAFAAAQRQARIAFDLGAGVGAVGLSLLHLEIASQVTMIEINPRTAHLAALNLKANGWENRAVVFAQDVSQTARLFVGKADLIVCNPPYIQPGSGHIPTDPSRAQARSGHLKVFISAARQLAGRRARICIVYPAQALSFLLTTLQQAGLEPKRLRSVHTTATTHARIVLIEATLGKKGGLMILPPLIERTHNGYSPELTSLLSSPPAREAQEDEIKLPSRSSINRSSTMAKADRTLR